MKHFRNVICTSKLRHQSYNACNSNHFVKNKFIRFKNIKQLVGFCSLFYYGLLR